LPATPKVTTQVAPVSAPVIKAEPEPLSITAAPQEETTPVEAPSVLSEDDFDEMVLDAMDDTPAAATPIAQSEPSSPAPAAPVATAPVIKEEPHPLAIKAHKKMRIVVDPGHGGKDPGATRSKYREKDWNLAVGNELARLLKKGNFEVKSTRETDVFIALSERSKIANNFKADLFVSVHVNSTKNSQAHGFQVYFRSEKATDKEAAATAALENEAMQYEEVHYNFVDALLQSLAKNEYINESSKLAGYVKNAVYKQSGIGISVDQKNCIRQANFYVLKGVQSPAILVEMGFISSPKDRGRLSQSSVQKKMAQGIYNGIVNYAKQEGWLK
ncbi:MAG: N-acetylmuramoyl-L-alanine amidase, partial [Elusimicrobiaceae bacterium]|nr:N-acetylmuramoyl-L-alanine amidase [Elusimicrobiaceae bacterium]